MRPRDYLDRIGASTPEEASAYLLGRVHLAHMLSVPFENLDIPLGREIVMDQGRFLDKIVRQRRGGFCYELNGAFAWLLCELGFDVRFLSARVFDAEGVAGPEFDHMALLVRIGGEEWVADVGFGDSFRTALCLVENVSFGDGDPRGIEYRFTEDAGTWTMWKSDPSRRDAGSEAAKWAPQYAFTLEPRRLEQYAAMCRHQQTSPEATFTRKVVCSKATPAGRVTLTATALVETTASGRVETPVAREDWHDVLRETFGIVLPAPITRWP